MHINEVCLHQVHEYFLFSVPLCMANSKMFIFSLSASTPSSISQTFLTNFHEQKTEFSTFHVSWLSFLISSLARVPELFPHLMCFSLERCFLNNYHSHFNTFHNQNSKKKLFNPKQIPLKHLNIYPPNLDQIQHEFSPPNLNDSLSSMNEHM